MRGERKRYWYDEDSVILNDDFKREVVRLVKEDNWNGHMIAEFYNIGTSTVYRILNARKSPHKKRKVAA